MLNLSESASDQRRNYPVSGLYTLPLSTIRQRDYVLIFLHIVNSTWRVPSASICSFIPGRKTRDLQMYLDHLFSLITLTKALHNYIMLINI